MSSAFEHRGSIAAVLMLSCLALAPGAAADEPAPAQSVLRVCADPNNMPFSNAARQGFENQLAELVARALGRSVSYTWWPQRRGFIRNTLRAETCDVVMGVPAQFEMALTTAPYYRSSYVFVSRRDRKLRLGSLDDSRLRNLRIGLHVIGDDYNNVPPAEALARRGIVDNVRGFSIYGAYSQPDPPRALIDAVAQSEIDVAIAWGPLAGYFARRQSTALELAPVPSEADPLLAMQFDIAMGVRRGDVALKSALDRVLASKRVEIRRLLARYGVPVVRG